MRKGKKSGPTSRKHAALNLGPNVPPKSGRVICSNQMSMF